jgi:hypothetical protein
MGKIKARSSLAMAAAVCLSSGLHAAEWQIDPYAKATTQFDDNIRSTSDNPEDSFVGILELGAMFSNESEIVKTTLSPRIRSSSYSSDSDLNNNAQLLDFSTRSVGERSTPSLDINLSRDSSLTSELEGAAGNVSVNKRRTRWSVMPAWSYKLTGQDALDISLQVESTSFDDVDAESLFDYDYQIAALAYVRSLSEIKDFTARLYQKQYAADEIESESDTMGIELGLSNKFTERTVGSLFLGGQATDSEIDQKKESNSGFTVRAVIDHETEVNKASVSLSRAVEPTSMGDVRNEDALRASWVSRVNVKLEWGLDALLQQNERVSEAGDFADQNFYFVEPKLMWNLTQEWKLTGIYRVSLREFDADLGDTDRNELGLSIEYRRPPREQLETPPDEIL